MSKPLPLPSQAYLREWFTYDGKTLRWRKGRMAGKVAGYRDRQGYILVRLDSKQYKAHRLIWKWVYGVDPQWEIDHIDGVPWNNAIENLRDVPKSINQFNRPWNTHQGVSKSGNGWMVRIQYKEVNYHFGTHRPFALACELSRLARAIFLHVGHSETMEAIKEYKQTNAKENIMKATGDFSHVLQC